MGTAVDDRPDPDESRKAESRSQEVKRFKPLSPHDEDASEDEELAEYEKNLAKRVPDLMKEFEKEYKGD